uniref:Uncharacterized protein n=1 Tax=Rhizophora mucronata TaxID=61149 RepID=A0A2P2QXV9_RHIMU
MIKPLQRLHLLRRVPHVLAVLHGYLAAPSTTTPILGGRCHRHHPHHHPLFPLKS